MNMSSSGVNGSSSSFGSYVSATGGGGGGNSLSQSGEIAGTAGVGSGGNINISGGTGNGAAYDSGAASAWGGGNSFYRTTGGAYGAGGYGGNMNADGGYTWTGGAGKSGIVIVEEIYECTGSGGGSSYQPGMWCGARAATCRSWPPPTYGPQNIPCNGTVITVSCAPPSNEDNPHEMSVNCPAGYTGIILGGAGTYEETVAWPWGTKVSCVKN